MVDTVKLHDDHQQSFYAHSKNDDGHGEFEFLRDHLLRVAGSAKSFAARFDMGSAAYAAGLVHDLGKYADQFQRRVQGQSERGKDHWTAGAVMAFAKNSSNSDTLAISLAVAAHHRGLDMLRSKNNAKNHFNAILINQKDSLTDADIRLLMDRYRDDGLPDPVIDTGGFIARSGKAAADMLDVRMLYSALVDSDFLETEAHFNGDAADPYQPRPSGPALEPAKALSHVQDYINQRAAGAKDSPFHQVRQQLRRQCLDAATCPTGLFTLTAPTGSGKTLAMLCFALEHAATHGLERIVLVMPFLNIIDQTAGIYREIFSPKNGFSENYVLEDHSLAGFDQNVKTDKERDNDPDDHEDAGQPLEQLLAENWDAPIILTTHVKCFESLMANRSSACRKLHRLAKSVLLFDEVQTLPANLAKSTLATLSRLASQDGPYRSSIVFATATQPAFDSLHEQVQTLAPSGWQPTEITRESDQLYSCARSRIEVDWRHDQPISLDNLTDEIAHHGSQQILCIVNLKRHAARITQLLNDCGVDNLYHLSTSMCSAHRRQVLEQINGLLEKKQPICLIATQCVEAGVDIDFPVVYRAFAPLDAIAQAAGRCNRHANNPRPGKVYVINPQDEGQYQYPPGYGEAIGATRTFLEYLTKQHGCLNNLDIINNPKLLRTYYQNLYTQSGLDTDQRDDEQLLNEALEANDFEQVAQHYQVIENHNTINVLTQYDQQAYAALIDEIENDDPRPPRFLKNWMGKARQYAVNVWVHSDKPILNYLQPLLLTGAERRNPELARWFTAMEGVKYDNLVGLIEPGEGLWIT